MHKRKNKFYLLREQNIQWAKNTSGKTKNNFMEELFQLFLHACKRLRSGNARGKTRESASKQANNLRVRNEMNSKYSSASRYPYSLIINNKSRFYFELEIFSLLLTFIKSKCSGTHHLWIAFSYLSHPWTPFQSRITILLPVVKIQFKISVTKLFFLLCYARWKSERKSTILTECSSSNNSSSSMLSANNRTFEQLHKLLLCWD